MTASWGADGPRPRLAADDGPELARLARFRQQHPGTAVAQGPGYWQAVTPEPGGETIITRFELGKLLDKLGEMYPPDG